MNGRYRGVALPEAVIARILKLYYSGTPIPEIVSRVGVSRETVYQHVKKHAAKVETAVLNHETKVVSGD